MTMSETDQDSELPFAAGNGIVDRRWFLKAAALGAAAAVTPAVAPRAFATPVGAGQPEWLLEPGAPTAEYGQPARFELGRVKRYVTPVEELPGQTIAVVARTPLDRLHGIYTPGGLHFDVNHHGIPDIAPDRHELVIHGMVERPLKFSTERLDRYPTISRSYFLECSGNSARLWKEEPDPMHLAALHGLLSGSEWTGVPLAILLNEAGASATAKWVIAEGADSGSLSRSIPMHKALDDSMIALYQNGERLRPGQGYPMRLLNPGFEGNTNVKWVRSLRVTDRPAFTRFETARYTELMPDGKALQFTLAMDVKSVITRPSNSSAPLQRGLYEITGLAWTGNGRIDRVEVSADGGTSWAEAEIQEPVLPRMLTRFRIPWRWNGAPSVLQSRATDETGRVQPTREALLEARGRLKRPGTYHFNGIQSWGVSPDGEVRHVYA
jgi:sulfane dehydrogenase subunit SoxC